MRADIKPERFAELLNKGKKYLDFGTNQILTVTNEGGEMSFTLNDRRDVIMHCLEWWEVERLIQFLQWHLENNKP